MDMEPLGGIEGLGDNAEQSNVGGSRTIWPLTTLASATLIIACIVFAASKRTFATWRHKTESPSDMAAKHCRHTRHRNSLVRVCYLCLWLGAREFARAWWWW